MKISVIIPYYQDYIRLNLLLEQLGKQNFDLHLFEVIVVNNDPSQNLDIEAQYFPFDLNIIYESIPGSYSARNAGISHAKGYILAFTDSDCLPDLDWLENAWQLFSEDFEKEIGVLTGPVPLFYKDPDKLTDSEVYEKYTGFTTESYAKQGHAITANWFSYKSVLEEFGGFNADLKSNGDSELSDKISKKYKIVYFPVLEVMHPARFEIVQLVNKYKRLLGGTFTRRFYKNPKAFRIHVIQFIFKRYRFALKKFFTISPTESWAILKVCHAINLGAIKEYKSLIKGKQTKR